VTGVERFYALILRKPIWVLLCYALVVGVALLQLPKLRLDASSDSLLLQGDPDLAYFRESAAKYAGDEFLILTWEPGVPLLSPDSLEPLAAMGDELEQLPGVASVTSVLDVPLLESPPLSLTALARADSIATLRDPEVDRTLALKELTTSPIYRNLLVSESGDLTAVQVSLQSDESAEALLDEREALRTLERDGALDASQAERLAQVEADYDLALARVGADRDLMVAAVRDVAERFRPVCKDFCRWRADDCGRHDGVCALRSGHLWYRNSGSHGGGAVADFSQLEVGIHPVADLQRDRKPVAGGAGGDRLANDRYLIEFGGGVVDCDAVIVDSPRGAISRVAAAASRSTPRAVICRCSKTDDGAVPVYGHDHHRGIHVSGGGGFATGDRFRMDDDHWHHSGFLFSVYGGACADGGHPRQGVDHIRAAEKPFTIRFAHIVQQHGRLVVAATVGLVVLSVAGVRALEVENRFIDYFKEHTEIYQGMELLDARLGGTIPLDVILEAPAEEPEVAAVASQSEDESWDEDDGFFDDVFDIDFGFGADETQPTGYWFSVPGRQLVDQVHAIIERRAESGKVLSLSTAFEVMDGLYGGKLGGVELALVENSLPDEVNKALVTPFYFAEEQEARLSVRVMETSESLRRDAYLTELREQILEETGIEPERLQFTSLLVLYNNVLQSLFQSQIMTLGAVFIAIGLMFWILFRSLALALLALAPNILAAGLVLGLMGLAGIPLDIMTITIAAIVVGIGVDDCIHYLHRFRDEIAVDQDYRAAMLRSHGSIGRAMYYTTLTVVVGFAMLTLSNFTPSLYFGVLTVVAMIAAVAGALLLLPKLIMIFRPFGPDHG
jgi:predicted RND superfamily exporter protein